ncbi:MAG TPA: hypothetical protein PLO89_06095, partial [Spirochaetota bacterium]|nr:hypothetical protein [Spirochaetota bacterium]
MTDKIYDTTKMRQELNCGYLITPVLRYYIHLFGKEKSAEYIESLGVSVKFLENKNNWVSYDYYLSLLEKLVEVTGDSNAPFLTAFTTNPQAYFEEFYFMTYATIASKSPKFGFKLAFSKKIYRRYTKIGDFEVIEENKNSMTIKLVLKEGYVQNTLNCLAIQGFMAAFPIAWGNKPAKVKHEECIAKGDSACIFKIEWETEQSRFNLIFFGAFSFFSVLSVVLKSYNIIGFKDIIIFFLVFLITYITSRSVVSSRKRKEEMGFNYKKNKYIFDAMEKIEKDYNEILSMKIELERRNKFLSIINEVNEKILKINDFNALLLNVADILIKNFDFEKAAFFRISKEEDKYESDFEIGNSKNILDEEKKRKVQIALGDYDKIKNSNYFMDYNIAKNLDSAEFVRWIKEGNCICSIPIETLDANGGFYLFV